MQAIVVRHGETDWNRLRRCQGFSDIPLNERGRSQAAATAALLAQRLDGSRPAVVHASPLSRAFETASIIASSLGATVRPEPDLRELNQGDYEGWAIASLPPAFLRRWETSPADLRFPNGESMRDLQARAVRAFHAALRRHDGDGTVPVLVAHNLTLAALLSDLLGQDLDRSLALCCEPAQARRVARAPDGAWTLSPTP